MHSCPSCAAPLDDEGICTSCGALTRGFFRGLDLGTPRIAEAVAHGLDFYRLLEVASDLDTRTIAKRYRQLRVLFPDDPAGLAAGPARRLALLELAGRVLTDPRLRQTYDELRAQSSASEMTGVVMRCAGCAAPFAPDAARCPYCGMPRPAEPVAPDAPPSDAGPPPTEPVDYYGMLGLTPHHLIPRPMRPVVRRLFARKSLVDVFLQDDSEWVSSDAALPVGPPTAVEVDTAALDREREILLSSGFTKQERDTRLIEHEIARRILRDDQRRSHYDALLIGFRQGNLDGGRLDALRYLQESVRAEMAEERGEQPSASEGAALLKQGLGYLDAGLAQEAVAALDRAVTALPRSAEAHAAYVRAILASDDPLALGGHRLREVLQSLDALQALGAAPGNAAALAALCRGLLARDAGDVGTATAELRHAAELDGRLVAAWRGLAALALGYGATEEALSYCRRALAIDQRDERALLMATAACLRAGQRAQARDVAAQIATVRGANWTADTVLRELMG